jgi:hypothetical protein
LIERQKSNDLQLRRGVKTSINTVENRASAGQVGSIPAIGSKFFAWSFEEPARAPQRFKINRYFRDY